MPYKNSKITAKTFLSTGLVMMGLSVFAAANALTPPQVSVQEIPFSFPQLPAEFNDVAQITDCGIWHSKQLVGRAAQKNDLFYCSFNDQSNKKSTLWLRELNDSGLFVVEKTELLRLLPASLTNGQFADIAADHQILMISAETYVPYGIKDKGRKEWGMDWSATPKRTSLEFVLQAAYVLSDGIVSGLFLSLDDIVALGDEGQLVRFNPSQNKPQWTLTLSYQANEQQMESMAQGDEGLEVVQQIQTQQPSLWVSAAGEILVHKISWQVGRGRKTKGNMGTGVWCVSADGKLKGQHFFADHFFDKSAMTALPQGGYVIWERIFRETSTVTLNGFSFNLITLDQNCQVTKQDKGSLPPAYLKNAQDGWIEDMQIQLTPAGDVLLIYTEHVTSDEMAAPQLNAALIAQDGEVKWTQPVVAQNNPYAWYLVKWGERGNIQLKIDVSFAGQGQSALISIFNPAPLRPESMNWLKPLQIRDRGFDNLLPKIYQLNWAK